MKPTSRQYVVVARHGLRQDEVDASWSSSVSRPWDPPLAEDGMTKVAELACALQHIGIAKVVSSPFLRCLSTARTVCMALHPPISQVEVDFSLCEIAAKPYFVGDGPRENQKLEDWMWSGETAEDSWNVGLGNLQGVHAGCSFPLPNESISDARKRYTHAIQAAADRADGGNVLLVTHGEAVGASVTRLHPEAVVQSVDHCGFTVSWRELDEDGDWGLWQLEGSGQGSMTGVQWRDPTAP